MAAKPDPAELRTLLQASTSAKRRRAARDIAKHSVDGLGDDLLRAYETERQDPRTWETQREMIRALGIVGERRAAPLLRAICERNEEHDALTMAAATAYVRLTREALSDPNPVLELMEYGRFSVLYGAFEALGCDRMVPDDDSIRRVLDKARSLKYVAGYGDPRYGVAVAAAGWKGEPVRAFLDGCLDSEDQGVIHAASNAIKGKYIKCR